ncbi:hypothetical protein [Wielerella bovis]|uniref:hypothetical protein n=1 Tax=Wielerella bovis TaxID=2917790 RepID=UPI00201915E9|nr:hypothetical protein [Wielerella bovis]ULJ64944.1 hypothetical protein MIS33_01155 [Wielerella bovis]ULJ67218.1 hypothetical protein MIS31_01160 [Wielerella bovis]
MKNKFAALIMATFVAMPVMAQDFNNQVFANQNVKAIELSQTEMKETQGEWVANAVGGVMGGVGGHFGYMAGAFAGGTYNRNAHLAAIGTGAVVGAFSPVKSATTFVTDMRGVALGTATGAVNGYAGSIGTNHRIR